MSYSISGAKESDYSCDEEPTAPCTPSHQPASSTPSPSRSRDPGPASATNSPSRRATNHVDGAEVEGGLAGGASAIGTLTFIDCGAGSEAAADAVKDEQGEGEEGYWRDGREYQGGMIELRPVPLSWGLCFYARHWLGRR